MSVPQLNVVRHPGQAGLLLDGSRRQLVEALAIPDSAAGLSRRLGIPRQRINYHLRLLEREGLVEEVERRKKGNCVERVVRATAQAFLISPEALGQIGIAEVEGADRAATATLMATAARALRDVAVLDAQARAAGKRVATLTIESEIRFATAESRAEFLEELVAAIGRVVAKHHDDRAPRGRRFRMVTLVHPNRAKEGTPDVG